MGTSNCSDCLYIFDHPEIFKSGTGFVTCTCGCRVRVGRTDMGEKLGAPRYVSGRYKRKELTWRVGRLVGNKGKGSRIRLKRERIPGEIGLRNDKLYSLR